MGMKKQRNNSLTKELREEESRSSNKSHSNSSNRFTLSIPGISHAEERGRVSPTRKAIWLLLFVVGLGLTAQQVHKVMTEYWAYPTKTKMEVVDSPLFVLPAVTVCTFNRIKCFGFASVLETCAQDNCTHLQDYCQMGVFSGCFMSVAMPLMEVFEENGTLPFPTYILQSCPAQVAVLKPGMSDPKEMVKLMDVVALRELYRNLSTERRTAIGMVGQDMVLSCRVNGEPCSDFFNVTTRNTAENGNCFTFNGGSEVGEVRTGPSAGMDIEFKLNRDEFSYTPDNEKEGLRVVLHDASEVPLMEEQGVDIQPSRATSFGIEVLEIERLPFPYSSQCVTSWNQTMVGRGVTYGYSMVMCGRFCLLKRIADVCGCIWHSMDDLNFREQLLNKTSTPFPTDYCSERNKTQAECIEVEMRTYDRTECGCKAQCKETVLKTQTSSSMWPSHIGWFYKALEHNLTHEMEPIDFSLISNDSYADEFAEIEAGVQADMAKLQIYVSSSRKTRIVEEPVFVSVFNLFTTLGGALSLWMGLSFIMIVEVVELIVDALAALICRRRCS